MFCSNREYCLKRTFWSCYWFRYCMLLVKSAWDPPGRCLFPVSVCMKRPCRSISIPLLLDGMLVHCRVSVPNYTPVGGERHCECKVSCFRPQRTVQFRPELEPGPTGPLDSEPSVTAVRLSRPPRRLPLRLDKHKHIQPYSRRFYNEQCIVNKLYIVLYIITKSMRALWLVNQLWVIVPVNPRKNRASSELLYKSNRAQVSMGYSLINHLGCWQNTRRFRKPLAWWFTNSSRVLPTSRVVYQAITHRNLWSIAFI